MAPTLIASYLAKTSSPTTGAITTASFTPSNGEILVVKVETWDRAISMSTPTGGSQTYTSRVAFAPAGFRPWVGIWTAVVSGSPGSMTVSSTPSANAQCSILVERWSTATLGGTPVTATANASSGAANGSLTTTAANSVISWVASDAQSVNPATRAYLGSATDEGVRDGTVGANGVAYHAYANVASVSATSFGLSAPTGMQYAIAGIEVLDAGGGSTVNGTASLAGAGALTATVTQRATAAAAAAGSLAAPVVQRAAATPAGAGSLAALATLRATAAPTGSGALTAAGSSSGGANATLAAAGVLSVTATQGSSAALTGAGTVSAAVTQTGKATLTGAGALSASGVFAGAANLAGAGVLAAAVRQLAGASLAGAGALTAASGGVANGTASLVGAGVLGINLNPSITLRPSSGTTAHLVTVTPRPDTGITEEPI